MLTQTLLKYRTIYISKIHGSSLKLELLYISSFHKPFLKLHHIIALQLSKENGYRLFWKENCSLEMMIQTIFFKSYVILLSQHVHVASS